MFFAMAPHKSHKTASIAISNFAMQKNSPEGPETNENYVTPVDSVHEAVNLNPRNWSFPLCVSCNVKTFSCLKNHLIFGGVRPIIEKWPAILTFHRFPQLENTEALC